MQNRKWLTCTDFVLIFMVFLVVSLGAYFLHTVISRKEMEIELPAEPLEQLLDIPMEIPGKKTA